MIKSIELVNIQSHKHSKIVFDNNYNCIVGSSNVGKTAIMRAFYWVFYNRPVGTTILNSSWNALKDGTPKDEFYVEVETDKGKVKRVRSKTRNSYVLSENGKESVSFDAVKTDVPQQVVEFLNLTNVNVQKQMDSPFLLSLSSPDATKFINECIHLDSIDKLLFTANTEKNALTALGGMYKKDLESMKAQIDSLKWLDKAKAIFDDFKKRGDSLKIKQNELMLLTSLNKQHDSISLIIVKNNKLKKFTLLISEIEGMSPRIKALIELDDSLTSSFQSYEKCESKNYDFRKQKFLISSFEKSTSNEKRKQDEIQELKQLQVEYNDKIEIISKNEKAMNELKKLLPDVCPYCGSLLKELKNA